MLKKNPGCFIIPRGRGASNFLIATCTKSHWVHDQINLILQSVFSNAFFSSTTTQQESSVKRFAFSFFKFQFLLFSVPVIFLMDAWDRSERVCGNRFVPCLVLSLRDWKTQKLQMRETCPRDHTFMTSTPCLSRHVHTRISGGGGITKTVDVCRYGREGSLFFGDFMWMS